MATPTLPKCVNKYCTIPARTFTMGSPNRPFTIGVSDENPQRQVTQSKPWQLRQTEVTINEYKAFLAQTSKANLQVVLKGCSYLKPSEVVVEGKPKESESALLRRARAIAGQASCSTDNLKVDRILEKGLYLKTPWCKETNSKPGNHPVVCVDQEEAEDFCASENAIVPPEFLLENASRGVSGTDKYGTPINKAIIKDNGYRSTAPVCGPTYERANSFGVCDLAGNVWELTSSEYISDYYKTMPNMDPNRPLTPKSRFVVVRGGAFDKGRGEARAANRGRDYPNKLYDVGGFRCARRVAQDSKKLGKMEILFPGGFRW